MSSYPLKQIFNVKPRFDWESKLFIEVSLKHIQDSEEFRFYESSPSKNKGFEKKLLQFVTLDLIDED